MEKQDWRTFNRQQLGRYAKDLAEAKFKLHGFDVLPSTVEGSAVDFTVRRGGRHYDIKVRSLTGNNYVFFEKDKFVLRENLFATVLIFTNAESPEAFLIPSTQWLNPNDLFVSRDYEGLKSKPEWGLNISERNSEILAEFKFGKIAETM